MSAVTQAAIALSEFFCITKSFMMFLSPHFSHRYAMSFLFFFIGAENEPLEIDMVSSWPHLPSKDDAGLSCIIGSCIRAARWSTVRVRLASGPLSCCLHCGPGSQAFEYDGVWKPALLTWWPAA
nr:uncharacterized protein LOC129386900 [Dermacentor andersoni]